MSEPLLLKPREAAEQLRVSLRSMYTLMERNPEIAAAVVQIPGLRGRFIRADLLRRAVERLSGGQA